MAELSIGKLRRLAAIQGVKVLTCGGCWMSEVWDDNKNSPTEAMLAPSIESEHQALVSVLEQYA